MRNLQHIYQKDFNQIMQLVVHEVEEEEEAKAKAKAKVEEKEIKDVQKLI